MNIENSVVLVKGANRGIALAFARELSARGARKVYAVARDPATVPAEMKRAMRAAFNGVFILAGGFDQGRAERALKAGEADLIAHARPFIANPNLVARLQPDAALNPLDMATFYTHGPKGYTAYPTLNA